ncbi:MAG: hypothetical protein ACLFQM_11795 [Fidelibacterota bacterium]
MRKLLLLMLMCFGLAMAKVSWFGYYEFEADHAKSPKADILFNYNKFRLDFDTNPAKNIHIGGDIVYKMYGGKNRFNISAFLDESFYAGLPRAVVDQMNFVFTDSLYFDNLFMDFHHKYFELTLGRQQLPTGVGYAWNPTDIFNKKDILDPTYENPGVDAIQLNVPVGTKLSLRGIVQPENTRENSKQFIEAKTWLSFADVSLVYARTKFDNRQRTKDLYGFNMEGDFFGVGFRAEFTANRLDYDNDNLKYEYIAGADYTFENSLYILMEYLHNDFGAEAGQTGIMDYLAYYEWQQKSLNQNYFFLMGMIPVTELIDGSLSTIINLDDESVVINPQILYRIYQNVELTIMGNIFVGNSRDEFGYQEFGGRIRLRAYF